MNDCINEVNGFNQLNLMTGEMNIVLEKHKILKNSK